jgi:GNAT superfamily N-acetyltransferase
MITIAGRRGRHDGELLAFVAVDARGNQIGAIAGYTWAGMSEIKQLWVDEDHRGCGLGRGLLEAAIAEASIVAANLYGLSPTTFRHQDFMRSAASTEWRNWRTGPPVTPCCAASPASGGRLSLELAPIQKTHCLREPGNPQKSAAPIP